VSHLQIVLKILKIHSISALPYIAGLITLSANHLLPQFFLGALFAGTNLAIVIWSAQQLLLKKPIALIVMVSVIKYSLLIGLAIVAIVARWKMDLGFILGISTLLPSVCIISFILNKNGQKWFTSTGHN